MFKFSETESAKGASFLRPGVYRMQPTNVTLGSFQKGTKYMEVTLQNEDDVELKEKFSLTEKALGRIQYLHEAFFGQKCNKDFDSEEKLVGYFKKALTGKPITKTLIVAGEIAGTNVYALLPFTNFVIDDESLELGEFAEDSEEWKKYVKKRLNASGDIADKPGGLINDDDDDTPDIGAKAPVKEDKNKKTADKTADKPAAKGAGKKTAPKEEPKADDDDDDMPW